MRTDRTFLCGRCSARFSRAERCPACGRRRVYDLTVARQRRNGLRMVRRYRGSRGQQLASRTADAFALYLAPLNAIAVGIATSSVWIGVATLICAWGAIALVATWVDGVLARARADAPVIPHIRLLQAPAEAATVPRNRVVGTVRVTAPVTAPLSGVPCAAFRIVGQGPAGDIDDAGIGRFVVEGDPAGPARVESAAATVELAVPEASSTIPRGKPFERAAAIYRFVRERGVCPHLGEVLVAEAVLVDGDPVEVVGSAEEIARPVGYRDTAFERLFRERDGAPLVVRSPPSE